MRTTRTITTALTGTVLAVAALASCGQGSASSVPSTPATSSSPAASASACTAALEKAGLDTVVQGAAKGGKYPAAVNRACNGLSPGAMKSAVNEAMSVMVNGGSATP